MDDDHTTGLAQRRHETTPYPIVRDRAGLISTLRRVDTEGWEGPTGTALLRYVRAEVVRPLVIQAGLRGAAASQAEASAWEAVWETMTKPSLRQAQSPWGVVWQVARRSVLGEIVAARFGTNERRGRSLAAAARNGELRHAASLEVVVAEGREPASAADDPLIGFVWRDLLRQACAALVDVGWEQAVAVRIVEAVLGMPTRPDSRCTIVGWRLLARDLDVPPWQARRLALALRGTATAPGLLPLLASIGDAALHDARVRQALSATRHRT